MRVWTRQGTPFEISIHGGGHILVIGPTGSGKSTIEKALGDDFQVPGRLTVVLDDGPGYELVARLWGGQYFAFDPECMPVKIDLFAEAPTKETVEAVTGVLQIGMESDGHRLSAVDRRDLESAVSLTFHCPPRQRTLAVLADLVSESNRRALEPFHGEGAYASVFGNDGQRFEMAKVACVNFQRLGRVPALREMVVAWLLWRLRLKVMDPSVVGVEKALLLDETWSALKHERLAAYIEESLRVCRKHNATVVLSTQSLGELEDSRMLRLVVESCPRQIFLPSPQLDREAYGRVFHLGQAEMDLIESLEPRKEALLKRQGGASKVLRFEIAPERYWVFTSHPGEDARRREVIEKYGFEKAIEVLAGGDQS